MGTPRTRAHARDVPPAKAAVDAEERPRSLLDATLDATGDGILVVGLDGTVTAGNRRFAEMWRIPPEIMESRDRRTMLSYVLNEVRDPESFLARIDSLNIEGARVAIRAPDGDVLGYVSVNRDVTERKRVEQDLREKTAQLQAVFDAFPDLFFRFDAEGRYVDYHAGRPEDLYDPSGSFIGKTILETLPSNVAEDVESVRRRVAASNEAETVEFGLTLEDGEKLFEARLLPLADGEVFAIVRDISVRKRSEEALRASEEVVRSLLVRSIQV